MYQLNGMGSFDFMSLVPTAAKLLTSGGGSGGAPITVSPKISTQVSPQISPIFQQQFQPEDSPISAGASMLMPSMPDEMYAPMYGMPTTNGALPVTTTAPLSASGTIFGIKTGYVILGAAVLAAFLIARKQTGKKKFTTKRVDLEV